MYIELFLLDNLLMNLLMLRLAAAMLSLRVSAKRTLPASFLGSCYAAVGAGFLPMLLSPAMKLVSGLLFALALPFRSFRSYLHNAAVLFLSAFTVGGAVLIIALAGGGSIDGSIVRCGISLRTALIGAAVASSLPGLIRRILARRVKEESLVRLAIDVGGTHIECAALVDTGCTLTEPLTGLPVILLPKKKFADAARMADIPAGIPAGMPTGLSIGMPVPMLTANGRSIVYALKPDRVLLNGISVDAYIAFTEAAIPLVPPMLITAAVSKNIPERKVKNDAEADTEPACAAARPAERWKRGLLYKLRRIPAPAAFKGAGDGTDE